MKQLIQKGSFRVRLASPQREEVYNPSRGRKAHATSRDYLEYLDAKLGVSQGTLYEMCIKSMKSRTVTKGRVTVTYRGSTEAQKRLKHVLIPHSKSVFLIVFKPTKSGKQHEKVVQVHLEL